MRNLLVSAAVLALSATLPPTNAADDPKPLVKPINLPCNTKADDDEPHVASNGLVLYYVSNAKGRFELMTARRASTAANWGAGALVEDYTRTDTDDVGSGGFATSEGRYPQFFYFGIKKGAKEKDASFDLFVAVRQGPGKGYSAPTPINTVDTAADEAHPWLTADGKQLYFSRKTQDGWRVFVASRAAATGPQGFGEPKRLDELPPQFHHATLTPDGKTMYLQGPLEKDRWGLFVSKKTEAGWGKPEPLATLNHPDGPTGDRSPNFSRDGSLLYFASDRPGGKGGLDLYVIATKELAKK